MMIKIGNAQGFWGDTPDNPKKMVERCPDLSYLTFDYLSELSLALFATERLQGIKEGFVPDFIEVIRSFIPLWEQGAKPRLISNAGALNPDACAHACRLQRVLEAGRCSGSRFHRIKRCDPQHRPYVHLPAFLRTGRG